MTSFRSTSVLLLLIFRMHAHAWTETSLLVVDFKELFFNNLARAIVHFDMAFGKHIILSPCPLPLILFNQSIFLAEVEGDLERFWLVLALSFVHVEHVREHAVYFGRLLARQRGELLCSKL